MQGPGENWNVRKHEATSYAKYNENMQWNQNFRPQGLHRDSIHNSDYQYWCETCDKGFMTAHFLENHKTQHQKCSIDGCQFVAHPKIITKHIQMQHSTGIFKRIAKLNNPEDIEKWREERKRKYPTIENIKKKEAATKEKINRGEKMGMKYERSKRFVKTEFHQEANQRPSQRGRIKHPQNKYNNNNNKNITNSRKRVATDVTKKLEFSKKICKVVPSIEESRTLKPFAGIQLLQIDDLDEETESETQFSVPIEDDEDLQNASDSVKIETSVLEPTVCSALTSLMSCYESSDEDDVETNTKCKEVKKPHNGDKTECKIESKGKNNNNINETKSSEHTKCTESISENINVELKVSKGIVSNCKGASDDESGPEEIEISKVGTNWPVDGTKIKPKKELCAKTINRPLPKTLEFRKRNKLPSTLLEKLLHREIQHERNVILQCVRYVVKNKYFENK